MKIPQAGCIKKMTVIIFILTIFLLSLSGGVAFGSSGEEHDAHDKGWVAEDSYRVMNFAVLFIGVFLLIRKPLSEVLNERVKGIKNQLNTLDEQKKDAEKKLDQCNDKLKRLNEEADEIVAQYITQGNVTKAKLIKEAEALAEKLKEQTEKNIEHEFLKAKSKLQNDIISKAIIKAEELIKNKITKKDRDKLIDEYLKKVVA